MNNDEKRILNINGQEYSVRLMGKQQYLGPLNRIFGSGFRYTAKGRDAAKGISICLSDEAIDQWVASAGRPVSEGELSDFIWQVLPVFIEPSDPEKKRIIFHLGDNIQKEEGVTYAQVAPTLEATARRVIFADEKPTNTQIRREILKICYAKWQETAHGFVMQDELLKAIPVSQMELERNLCYLVEGNLIEGKLTSAGYMAVRINKYGIDVYENPDTFNKLFSLKIEQQTINVGGDIVTTTVNGSNNTTIVKSQISEAFNVIKEEIKEMDFEKKEEAIELIGSLEIELQKEKPEPGKVKEFWDKIKGISDTINDKILSHPIIAQLIATQLLNFVNPAIVH